MAIRAVVFDVGGVLERVEEPEVWLEPWRRRLGMSVEAFDAALGSVDPDGVAGVGGLTEVELVRRSADALGLSPAQVDEYVAGMWDWYCGELDEQLMAFAAGLRTAYLTAILSNSADGARREEEARYAFSAVFDLVVYSHEVGLAKPDPRVYALTCRRLGVAPGEVVFVDDVAENVVAAEGFGMRAVLHREAAATISAVEALLAGRG